jgi:PPP family 3-phenylpropionic acid transporter
MALSPLQRFVVLYALLYAAFGTMSPFLPAWLGGRGLSAEQISIVMGLATAVRLASGPLAGRVADRRRAWRAMLSVCGALAGLLALALLPAHGFAVLLMVTVAQASALAPLVPLLDALALDAAVQTNGAGFEYGWVRGAGSAAFIAGTIAAGRAVGSLGLGVILWLGAALLLASTIAATAVRQIGHRGAAMGAPPSSDGVGWLLRQRGFRRLLLVAALVLGSHALHDTFAVIRWEAAGIGTATASLLWSESVASEVVVFLLIGPALLRILGPARAATLAAVAGTVRWTVMGATNQVLALALIEPLHGLTFALLHLAAMRLIADTIPDRLAATAQAIYGTLAVGAATTLLTLASGWLYAHLQGAGFWMMALSCATAVPLALRLSLFPSGRSSA